VRKLSKNGSIVRWKDGTVAVRVGKKPWGDQAGVVCVNQSDPENERIYEKAFENKKIYLSHEYEKAIAEVIAQPDSVVLSMNGYSQITAEQCVKYGVQAGDYEEACSAILREAIIRLKKTFSGASLKLVYGASDTGVDKAIEVVAREFNLTLLGFSCPEFMMYVKDDDIPVYVAKTIADYADFYIRSLDLLIATGGRAHALTHDISASCVYNKRIHFIDVLNSLSSTGGVPATISDGKGGYKVDNAAAAFGRNISFFSRDDAVANMPNSGDKWDAIFANVNSVAVEVCRQKMSPARKFK
jgi:hypothetical protein